MAHSRAKNNAGCSGTYQWKVHVLFSIYRSPRNTHGQHIHTHRGTNVLKVKHLDICGQFELTDVDANSELPGIEFLLIVSQVGF